MAPTPSVPDIRTVVLLALAAPPAATANAIADILSLFGTSQMKTTSYSPKQYQPPTSLPPTAPHGLRLPGDSARCSSNGALCRPSVLLALGVTEKHDAA